MIGVIRIIGTFKGINTEYYDNRMSHWNGLDALKRYLYNINVSNL